MKFVLHNAYEPGSGCRVQNPNIWTLRLYGNEGSA